MRIYLLIRKWQLPAILCYWLIVLNMFWQATEALAQPDVRILQSDLQGLTIQIQPQSERTDTLLVQGSPYYQFYINGAEQTGKPGEPMTPMRVVNIGMPLEADATVELLSAEYREISGRVAPVPDIDRHGNRSYQRDELIYRQHDFYPQQLVEFDPPAYYRNQRILTIRIKFLQFSGQLEKIRLYQNIVLKISFSGKVSDYPDNKSDDRNDHFYQNVILNYDQSKKWLREKPAKAELRKSRFTDREFFQMTIKEEGFYKISGSDLEALGVNLNEIDPSTIQIYNNGGVELPRDLATPRPDSLIENAIRVFDGGDNIFNSADYILFYCRPVNYWTPLDDSSSYYQHYINRYTDKNVYWLTWGNNISGKRMQTRTAAEDPELDINYDFFGRFFNEDEINNFLHSGLEWFGRLVAGNQTQGYSAYLPHANNVFNNIFFRIQLLGMTTGPHRFQFYFNDKFFANYTFNGNQLKTFETFATLEFSQSGYNNLRIEYSGYSPESQAYVDWFEIQYRRRFAAENDYLWFSQLDDGPQKYYLTNFSSNNIQLYDITDWVNVEAVSGGQITSGSLSFVDDAMGFPRRQYIAITEAAFRKPLTIEKVTLAGLREQTEGADFIIITHDDFYQSILPLQQHREQRDNLKTMVIKVNDIYNEFSWGLFDPTAIRDFIKHGYENYNPQPAYVLLCGDGTYDYKNIISNIHKNWVPTYQTTELSENINRTSDDWFVTVHGSDNKPDLAIGRFPVQSAEEVENVVKKIISYENQPLLNPDDLTILDDWRNVVTMVADDELTSDSDNETIHTRDAEMIIEGYVPNSFEKAKVYLIEYTSEKDPSTSGIMKPAATAALLERINKGTLIVNYVGHGAPQLWAHERVLKESRDFERILNKNKLAFWVAATCDFGRFDDPLERGLAEKLFAAKDRGGVGFMSSARLAYATDNTALNRRFFTNLFYGEKPTARLGIALMKAKLSGYNSTNDQKYHLYGDPTMRLNAPQFDANITQIQPDTLKALETISVSGNVSATAPELSGFSGKALLKVYDSQRSKSYVTARNSIINYISPGKSIFRGIVSVEQGQFSGRLIVPKDINYGGDQGRVSLYFADHEIHGVGYRNGLSVGGTAFMVDHEGPLINIGFQGQKFFDGGVVGKNAILEVEIADSVSGVNIVGEIGHHITMVLDDQESNPILLTDYFNYYENNHKAGLIIYDFGAHQFGDSFGLPEGEHKITIKAWDNFNNSSIVSVNFSVVADDVLEITNLFNFPNPFSSNTTFTFAVNHDCDVKIKIYTVRGTLIQTLEAPSLTGGYNQIFWDGRDRDGDQIANGVYLYKVIAKKQQLDRTLSREKIGKLVMAR